MRAAWNQSNFENILSQFNSTVSDRVRIRDRMSPSGKNTIFRSRIAGEKIVRGFFSGPDALSSQKNRPNISSAATGGVITW